MPCWRTKPCTSGRKSAPSPARRPQARNTRPTPCRASALTFSAGFATRPNGGNDESGRNRRSKARPRIPVQATNPLTPKLNSSNLKSCPHSGLATAVNSTSTGENGSSNDFSLVRCFKRRPPATKPGKNMEDWLRGRKQRLAKP